MSCCSSEFIDYCDALRYTMHRYIKNCIDTSITILHIAIRRCIDVSSHLYFVVHDPAVEYTFQITKLNIKRSLAKPVSTISEQTVLPGMRTCPRG